MSPVLSRSEILSLIKQDSPLVEDYINLEEQIQTNGFDLTVRSIDEFKTAGAIGLSNTNRVLSQTNELTFRDSNFGLLLPGSYLITFNEIVHLPLDVMALGRTRSSLLRCGVAIHTAVWDAGYSGRSQALMVIYNNHGFNLARNARVLQLVFFKLSDITDGYRGVYLNENI